MHHLFRWGSSTSNPHTQSLLWFPLLRAQAQVVFDRGVQRIAGYDFGGNPRSPGLTGTTRSVWPRNRTSSSVSPIRGTAEPRRADHRYVRHWRPGGPNQAMTLLRRCDEWNE